MHILLTNDDGIFAPGLKALANAAIARGHQVSISAPSQQCSANSQHITLSSPIMAKEIPWENAKAYAIDGTPADCVRIAPALIDEKIDFCISGINKGENAGACVYYSGTVSAAREAAMLYMPAIAVSLMSGADDAMRKNMAEVAVKMAEKFQNVPLPKYTVINLNAPALPPEQLKPMKLARLSPVYCMDVYQKRLNPHGQPYFWLVNTEPVAMPLEKQAHEPGTDYAFLQEGHITCTFLGALQDYNEEFANKMQDL